MKEIELVMNEMGQTISALNKIGNAQHQLNSNPIKY
ncbi:hypothetical protein P872_01320 [Rhodonellum psychrophilum GCM71 = DSM 17998]|uniref:Uncharacterized protein n=1 Tax=Rhodonellum psychrophilum GCM71 = DSM 17998 TaxID=1123057 RepID=U5C1K0_9BACT|nr:hypothetical protein P872_01320 [Rhodonellum psychrophilum GCM71 = DSM 17998]